MNYTIFNMPKLNSNTVTCTKMKENCINNENCFNNPSYYTNREQLLNKPHIETIKINTPLPIVKSNKYFYFACDINNRTPFEDSIIKSLLNNNIAYTADINKADYYLGYSNDTFKECLNHKFKKAISLSTMIYPTLTYGIDDNELIKMPLNRKLLSDLKHSDLNQIDKIDTDILIIHGYKEVLHPWLQASFLYSSLKDRRENDHSKMIIVPDIDEQLYNNPNKDLLDYLNKQIVEFFKYEN